jgi:hypothetical protein
MNQKQAQQALLNAGYEYSKEYDAFVIRNHREEVILALTARLLAVCNDTALEGAVDHYVKRARELLGERQGDSGQESATAGREADAGVGESDSGESE